MKAEYFSIIRQGGFSSVRLPINWEVHATKVFPYTIDSVFSNRVKWAVEECLKNGMMIILVFQNYPGLVASPASEKERFRYIWNQVAEIFKDYSNDIIFEIFNEPNGNLTTDLWNTLLEESIKQIRLTNPNRTLIVEPADWTHISSLAQLRLPATEKNLILSFHYYDPFTFTHQGAEWVEGSSAWLGTTWRGSPDEIFLIKENFFVVYNWAVRQEIPVNIGEFGAYSKADMDSRVRWTTTVARSAEELGFNWHYWEFCAGFGVYNRTTSSYIPELLQALIPFNRLNKQTSVVQLGK